MKFPIVFICVIILLFLISGCKKDPDETTIDCTSSLDFTKITIADNAGNIISVDTTDWTNDAAWCEKEYGLFNTHNLDLTGSDTSRLVILLFPNPLTTVGTFMLMRPKLCPFQCVIINRAFQVLDTFSIPNQTGNSALVLNFSGPLKYKPGEYYRIYYAAHCTSQLFFFKGHGDFKIE